MNSGDGVLLSTRPALDDPQGRGFDLPLTPPSIQSVLAVGQKVDRGPDRSRQGPLIFRAPPPWRPARPLAGPTVSPTLHPPPAIHCSLEALAMPRTSARVHPRQKRRIISTSWNLGVVGSQGSYPANAVTGSLNGIRFHL